MFGSIMQMLSGGSDTPENEMDEQLALAALLVQIARSDGNYAAEEIEQIDRTLTAYFDITPFESAALRSRAEATEAAAADTVRFTRAIKDHVPHEDRIKVMRALWQVVLADGTRDHEENSILRLAASLLGVSDRDSNLARRSVENGR